MAQQLFASVERSLVPGLTRVPITRCGHSIPVFQCPDVVEAPLQAAAGEAGTDGLPQPVEATETADYSEPVDPVAHDGTVALGGNVLVGGMFGLLSRLLQPTIRRRTQGMSPLVKPVMEIGGQACIAAVASALVKTVSSNHVGAAIGQVVMKIPMLRSDGPMGSALRFGLGTWIGDTLGGIAEKWWPPDTTHTTSPIFVSNICIWCNAPFVIGSGDRVAAMSCGHACLCGHDSANHPSCAAEYLQQCSDCPLCRSQDVVLQHELVL
eukprot:TRINITY_DN100631_c0_g1_i1.p1 TRINITY_DN100631_c0_g1~~TRINITY_DN100631_c0_g1_i1.p1  ORF type:complete len:266 (+),score=14.54 TRINITY_DN100631_c0_g1_i1:34-831(+)